LTVFNPKNSQKYGMGIRDREKTYSGTRGKKTPDPQIRMTFIKKKTRFTGHTVAYPVLLALFKSVVDGEIPAAPGGHGWLIS
jgi:hypothetical protein